MRFGIMAMQVSQLVPAGLSVQQVLGHLSGFDHAALVRGNFATSVIAVVPASGAVDVRTGEVTLIPVEAAFLRAGTLFPRPGSVPPAHVGPGPATLAAETSFPCSRLGAFSTARTELWKVAVTLVTSAGSFYVQTADQLRVEYR